MSPRVRIETGDALDVLRTLDAESVHCCVTSPPYFGLRDYGHAGQIGLEPTPEAYVARLVDVFREVRRVLCADGTLWLNLGDSYANDGKWGGHSGGKHDYGNGGLVHQPIGRMKKYTGLKPKDLIGIPWMVAFALRADGWYLRSDIIWHKPNPMPESVTDRPTKAHEYLFLLSKSARYYYDAAAIAERATCELPGPQHSAATNAYENGSGRLDGGTKLNGAGYVRSGNAWPVEMRNKRTVWTVPSSPYAEAHFATFPPALIEPCVRAGCPVGGTVLDCFAGSGTTGLVALQNARNALLIELNPAYRPLIESRCAVTPAML